MKHVIFLPDGMADEPIESLGGKTPLEAADTPNIDRLADSGRARFGTFRSLPDDFPTSSDVANLSVLGYDLAMAYQGRGPLEAASQGVVLEDDEVAMRCNLITVSDDGLLLDYSGGQIPPEEARSLIAALQEAFGSNEVRFLPGVSYRNLLILKGKRWSADFAYEKPDDHPGDPWPELLPSPRGPESEATTEILRTLILNSRNLLDEHPVNARRVARGDAPANMIWPWSAGRKPAMPPFAELYGGRRGAIVSAVDVIKGIGRLAAMDVIEVEGATGYVDTNYEGKARAAVRALRDCDFVYLHTEATDEVSHAGDLEMKLRAIEDFDRRIVGTFLEAYDREFAESEPLACALLPDHPVPVALRRHTRTPVPVMIIRPDWTGDAGGLSYSETDAPKGSLGELRGDGVMRTLFGEA